MGAFYTIHRGYLNRELWREGQERRGTIRLIPHFRDTLLSQTQSGVSEPASECRFASQGAEPSCSRKITLLVYLESFCPWDTIQLFFLHLDTQPNYS